MENYGRVGGFRNCFTHILGGPKMISMSDVGLIFQIAGLAIITTILAVVVAIAIVLMQVVPVIKNLFTSVEQIFRLY